MLNYYILSNNVPTNFSDDESDFLPVSGQRGLNFNAHSIHSLIGRPWITSLNNFYTASKKRLVKQTLINKMQNESTINPRLTWRRSFLNMFTSLCNYYVTALSILMIENLTTALEEWTLHYVLLRKWYFLQDLATFLKKKPPIFCLFHDS